MTRCALWVSDINIRKSLKIENFITCCKMVIPIVFILIYRSPWLGWPHWYNDGDAVSGIFRQIDPSRFNAIDE